MNQPSPHQRPITTMTTKPQHPLAEAVLAHFGIKTFDYIPGLSLHAIERDGQLWFVAKDVCDALGYVNGPQALADHVDPDERDSISIRYGKRGNPVRAVVNESGLYSLIFRSNKTEAKAFRKWVTGVVLPSIRMQAVRLQTLLDASPRMAAGPVIDNGPAFNFDEKEGRRGLRRRGTA
jgi:hypothetical protein